MANVIARLFKRNPVKPPKASPEDRRRQELARVEAESKSDQLLSEAERALSCFTVEEKRELYALRNLIKWLPTTIPGGIFTAVSQMMTERHKKASKQYVQQCLFPSNPLCLFTPRNINYKQIWVFMKEAVENRIRVATPEEARVIGAMKETNLAKRLERLKALGKTLEEGMQIQDEQSKRDQYRASLIVLTQLEEGNTVVVTNGDLPRIAFIRSKIKQHKLSCQVHRDDSTLPPVYVFEPVPPEPGKEPMRPDTPSSFPVWLKHQIASNGGIRVIGHDSRLLGQFPNKRQVGNKALYGETKSLYHILPEGAT